MRGIMSACFVPHQTKGAGARRAYLLRSLVGARLKASWNMKLHFAQVNEQKLSTPGGHGKPRVY